MNDSEVPYHPKRFWRKLINEVDQDQHAIRAHNRKRMNSSKSEVDQSGNTMIDGAQFTDDYNHVNRIKEKKQQGADPT